MKRKHRRLAAAGFGLGSLAVAAALAALALGDRVSFFYTPSDLQRAEVQQRVSGRSFQLGGLVAAGSLQRQDALHIRFDVADNGAAVPVAYRGLLPDLFREGQGVVATGRLSATGTFEADTLLAKHDETYMPPALKERLETSGHPGDSADARP